MSPYTLRNFKKKVKMVKIQFKKKKSLPTYPIFSAMFPEAKLFFFLALLCHFFVTHISFLSRSIVYSKINKIKTSKYIKISDEKFGDSAAFFFI